MISISADFKGYPITFEPIHGKRLAKLSVPEVQVYEKGFELEEILRKPAKPFVEWTS